MERNVQLAEASRDPRPFARTDLSAGDLRLLHRKRWGQAQVRVATIDGQPWVIKDFSHSIVAKYLWGRWLLSRELRALRQLDDVPGTPDGAFRLDRDAICYHYVAGETLRDLRHRRETLDGTFFYRLEETVGNMHARGVAHMDLGNLRNLLVNRSTGQPHVIDFGSALFLAAAPFGLATRMRRIDRSRLYKCWRQLSPDTLDDERRQYLQQHYHKHHFKPKHWGSQMTTSIRQFFHNPTLRKGFRAIRLPLGILLVVLLASQIKEDWFWPGAAISTLGALLQAWAFACIDTQTTLANRGPYSLVRNPQYITRFLLVIGIVVMTGNPWLIAIASVIYYFYAVTRVEREEALLPEVFGAAYRTYCESVPRFVPRLANLDRDKLLYWNPRAFRKNHGLTNLATVFGGLLAIYLWVFLVR
ncbi:MULTISPECIES: methyltransferase [Marinobacter]|uniref:Protein kinase domain-containing protein n=1 Tax=Marinobacter profundi TaxID=2666256 RepID=A0A2G1UM92_9GAMM|nr:MULTISPECIES: methyltransferase [Marinobacter]MBD3655107.1 hypothetical protein [Marinobacter sp.]PHQ15549.1 hypothetical protein CLH61_07735 [Marinobacter profundi]